jgi:hypothetical protein
MINKKIRRKRGKLDYSIRAKKLKAVYIILSIALLIVLTSLISTNALSSTPKVTSNVLVTQKIQEAANYAIPQFNVDVMYAYAGPNIYGKEFNSTYNGFAMHPASLYPDMIYFNLTYIHSAEKELCDAKIEVYQVQILTDTGLREKYTCFFGTNYSMNKPDMSMLEPAISQLNGVADTQSTSRISGLFCPNINTNESLWFKVGSFDSTTNGPSSLGLWSAGTPNSIAVSVSRLGWITFTGKDASITRTNIESSSQVNLAKSGAGFLYNVIPQNKMSQTDPFHPIDLYKPLA